VFFGDILALKKGYEFYSLTTQRNMLVDVTFLKDTPFFSSSLETPASIQHVLPIPGFCPLIIYASANSNSNENQSSIAPPHPLTC